MNTTGFVSCIILSLLLCIGGYAQTTGNVRGYVSDSSHNPLPGAVVTLIYGSDSVSMTVDTSARFSFPNIKSSRFQLRVSFIGYQPFYKRYDIAGKDSIMPVLSIVLASDPLQLGAVIVQSTIPVRVKEDTIQYSAKAFKVREGDAVEEVIKKLPGMEVDENGNMTIQGEPIKRVKLNGKDFFGDDAVAAIQNLPADIVKNLQVIDDYGDKAGVTGVKGTESEKILNINLEPDKDHGYFGKASAGIGTENRYEGRLRSSMFRGDQKISFDGSADNTERGDGISDRKSLKVNYHDNWGPALESYGSYRYTNRQHNILSSSYSQSVFQDYTKTDDENRNNQSGQEQHGLSWNFEYRIDSNNYLKVKPNISRSRNNSYNTGMTKTFLLGGSSLKDNQSRSNSTSSDIGSSLFYNHKFPKAGRNLSLEAVIGTSESDAHNDTRNKYTITDSSGLTTNQNQFQQTITGNTVNRTSIDASYIEPLSATSYAVLEYGWNRSSTENIRNTSDVDAASGEKTANPQLSNNYNYQFITHRIGARYQFKQDKLKYSVGLSAQPTVLKGTDISRGNTISRNQLNLVPLARLVYNFSKKQTFTARYSGKNQMPGFIQLQPVTDNSDLQNTVTGNPDLKPEFTNNLRLEYKQSDWSSGGTMQANVSLNQTQNKIVTTRVIIADSLREKTSYVNTNGFYNINGSYSITKPFSNRRFLFTYYCNTGFSNNIAFTNGERVSGKDLEIRNGMKFRADLADIIDAELNTAWSFNNTSYSSAAFNNRQIHRIFLRLGGRNYLFRNNCTLGYNLSHTINSGYNTGNASPTLLNVYVEWQLLKSNKGTVRLSGFDLLNQNTGITRDVFDNKIVDQQNNRLARYFMLSFNYRLQRFGGS